MENEYYSNNTIFSDKRVCKKQVVKYGTDVDFCKIDF